MNKYHLQVKLLSSSSLGYDSTITKQDEDAILQSAVQLNEHCERLLCDFTMSQCSSPSYSSCAPFTSSFQKDDCCHRSNITKYSDNDDKNVKIIEQEPFISYVDSMHLYQESNNNDDECLYDNRYPPPRLPLVAIVIPVDVLHYIENSTFSTDYSNTSAIFSNILSKIHPSLTYLQPCGLLRSVPIHLPISKPLSTNNSKNTEATQKISDIDEENKELSMISVNTSENRLRNNSFDILLLKLNSFNAHNERNNEHRRKNHDNKNDDNKDNVNEIENKTDTRKSRYQCSELSSSMNDRSEAMVEMKNSLMQILEEVNGESMEISPTSVIQALPISNISFLCKDINSAVFPSDEPNVIKSNDDGDDDDYTGSNTKSDNKNNKNSNEDKKKEELEFKIKSNKVQHEEYSLDNHGIQQHLRKQEYNDMKKCQRIISEVPICPVCRFRIEPQRLGLELNRSYQKCSHADSDSQNNIGNGDRNENEIRNENDRCCKNMQFLSPWEYPSYCEACHILQERLRLSGAQPFLECNQNNIDSTKASICSTTTTMSRATLKAEGDKLSCFKCGMKETLWVCLSCGFIGCGRYSHGHAEEHYNETIHPFSLELATQRIWDYTTSSFVNRDDLLNCKYMQQILGAKNRAAYQQGAASVVSFDDNRMGPSSSSMSTSCHNTNNKYNDCDNIKVSSNNKNYKNMNNFDFNWDDGTTPKKAAVVGEEYEALLQSALEDQAQHFELEIAHLQAQLASEAIDMNKMSTEQMIEVKGLEKEIADLRVEVDVLSREYVDIQAQEAGHRAKSNSLLREQGVTKELLAKIQEEATREHLEGKQMVEDLEQQISDLTANIKMRRKFAGDQELSKAQIYGTSGKQRPSKKKGFRRSRR